MLIPWLDLFTRTKGGEGANDEQFPVSLNFGRLISTTLYSLIDSQLNYSLGLLLAELNLLLSHYMRFDKTQQHRSRESCLSALNVTFKGLDIAAILPPPKTRAPLLLTFICE